MCQAAARFVSLYAGYWYICRTWTLSAVKFLPPSSPSPSNSFSLSFWSSRVSETGEGEGVYRRLGLREAPGGLIIAGESSKYSM